MLMSINVTDNNTRIYQMLAKVVDQTCQSQPSEGPGAKRSTFTIFWLKIQQYNFFTK
jgi:hypothetical protein